MNLGDFHTLVKDVVNLGTELDATVAIWTRQAARWIERNHSLAYMERFVSFTLSSGDRTITFPEGAKKIDFVRRTEADGDFFYIQPVKPVDIARVGAGDPECYWRDGVDCLYFNKIPDDDVAMEMSYTQFTDPWPTSLTATHWLLDNAEDVMLGQTIFFASAFIEDTQMQTRYQAIKLEGLKTLFAADEELRNGGLNGQVAMIYKGES